MPKKTFLLILFFAFLFSAFNVFAQNVYTDSINKAKEVKNQVEEKTQKEVETATEEITTTPVVTTTIETQNQTQSKDKKEKFSKSKGEEHKSQVAIAVIGLLNAADRFETENPGIGKEVRVIAQEQSDSAEKIVESANKIEGRNKAIKFLIGPNYGEIKNIEKELEQNRLRIKNLNQIMNELKNEGDKNLLQEQIQILENENTELQNFLDQEEKGFSLFGWLAKIFN